MKKSIFFVCGLLVAISVNATQAIGGPAVLREDIRKMAEMIERMNNNASDSVNATQAIGGPAGAVSKENIREMHLETIKNASENASSQKVKLKKR